MDLFATKINHWLPLFVSPMYDLAVLAVDALSLNWDLLFGYAFPLFILIPMVLQKVLCFEQCRILLIAPCWPLRSWFNDLLREGILFQQSGRPLHTNLAMFHLHAWMLSSVPSKRDNFLTKLPLVSPSPDGFPLESSRMLSGQSLQIGVLRGRSIQSLPL